MQFKVTDDLFWKMVNIDCRLGCTIILFIPGFCLTEQDLLLHTGTGKRHNVCKRHVAIETCFKQTERTIFSPHYFNEIKIATACFQVHFWKNYAKIVSRFWKSYLRRLSQEPISQSVCNFGFTASQYSDKCWSNLPLLWRIFLIGNTQRGYWITCAIIRFMLWLVCLEPATTCWLWSIITLRHHITVPAYCISK